MRLLLDTHIALWAISEPERLDTNTQSLISQPDNHVSVSIVALWEIAIKRSVKRKGNDVPQLSARDTQMAFFDADFELCSIHIEHLHMVEALPFHHRDPFDRLIVAQAMSEGFTLLTRDKALAAYGDFVMVV